MGKPLGSDYSDKPDEQPNENTSQYKRSYEDLQQVFFRNIPQK